ncbi:MAG: hypothetical protein ACP5GI_07060 [Sulfolobales archaeon]
MTEPLNNVYIEEFIVASLNSIELIPLAYYKPGGLAFTIYVFSSEEGCFSCPWREYYGSKKAFDLRKVSLDNIIRRYNELRADLLFFSGGDFLSRDKSRVILEILRSYGVNVGVKHNLSKKVNDKRSFENIDVVLAEVNALTNLRKISDFIDNISRRNIYVEFIVDDISEDSRDRVFFTVWVKDLCRVGNYAIAFYMADKSEYFIESYSSLLQKFCENKYYIITSHQKYVPETVNCMHCGASIGRRVDGVVIKKLINNDKCPRCGSKVFFGGEIKRFVGRTIFTRVMI